ncbi:MAG: hypothetical protein RLY19_191, partial [Actinomycetota bacterium]
MNHRPLADFLRLGEEEVAVSYTHLTLP